MPDPEITILPRWQSSQVMQRLKDRRILLLSGARQCGKTTLAKQLRGETVERAMDGGYPEAIGLSASG